MIVALSHVVSGIESWSRAAVVARGSRSLALSSGYRIVYMVRASILIFLRVSNPWMRVIHEELLSPTPRSDVISLLFTGRR